VAANFTVHSCGGSRGIDRVPFLASATAEEPRKRKATHRVVMGQWGWGLVMGAYPLLRVPPLAVSLLQRLTFPDAEK
jgi:hypothetical protein